MSATNLAFFDDRLTRVLDVRTLEILAHPSRVSTLRRRGWLVRRMLLLADIAALVLAFLFAVGIFATARETVLRESVLLLATLPVWALLAKLYGLYDRDEARADFSSADELTVVFNFVTSGAWLFFVAGRVSGLATPSLSHLIAFWAFAIPLVVGSRGLARYLSRRSVMYLQNTVVVGAGDIGQLIARKLLRHPEYGINLVGFVDVQPKKRQKDVEHVAVLGGPELLPEIVHLLDIERIVLAFSNESNERMVELVRSLRGLDVQIDVVPRLFDIMGPKADIHSVEGLPLVGLSPVRISRSSCLIKRSIDVVGALFGLLLTAPLLVVLAALVKRDSKGPVFFRQQRLGGAMREFTALKFRTMHIDADDAPHRAYIRETMSANAELGTNGIYKLEREDAITPVGRWLRKTSLDELPQLINVLRGDMSLVGPRPCIPYETEHFAPHHFDRFLVPAGVTGLWQVHARGRSTFGEALEMDVAYARGWSLGLDFKLLFLTPIALFRRNVTA